MSLVEIKQCENKYLIFKAKDVERLRKEYRIVGALCGTLPDYPLQNTFYGLPLCLSPEEVDLLLSLNAATVKNTKSTPSLPKRNDVFRYFWSLNYHITSGYKFGGDYLLYPGDPMCFHSQFIVSVKKEKEAILPKEIVLMGRLATNVKKMFLLAGPREDGAKNEMMTYSVEWAGF
ncbi:hypothetical protein G6F37_006361 [Rhizopus arrhizus]|nr:hypothetical protein G6F38_013351 [Rhizopus arrhizus]KAG1157810.1 hypothetical protein G6F37_006361 [Rhizopus arrhizus]